MNATELRQAAELATEWDGYIHHENKPAFAAWKMLACHILATVREDDDELIDDEWFWRLTGDGYMLELPEGRHLVLYTHSLAIDDSADSVDLHEIKTRGDFRTLCRLLGVTLREPSPTP